VSSIADATIESTWGSVSGWALMERLATDRVSKSIRTRSRVRAEVVGCWYLNPGRYSFFIINILKINIVKNKETIFSCASQRIRLKKFPENRWLFVVIYVITGLAFIME
jgi:hypothetical protein